MKILRFKLSTLLTTLITITSFADLYGQALPRVVVCVNLKGLRGDLLSQYRSSFGENGFNRLFREGVVFPELTFDFDVADPLGAIASLWTGTYPLVNGISHREVFSPHSGLSASPFLDKDYKGIYTIETLSPLALKSETLSDVLRQTSQGRSPSLSIAAEAEDAIVSAGTNADLAVWIGNISGNWATSSYYGSLPLEIEQVNSSSHRPRTIAQSAIWKGKYENSFLPYHWGKLSFEYSFTGPWVVENFKHSPLVNKEVIRLATRWIEVQKKKSRAADPPILLNLTLNLRCRYNRSELSDYGIEVYDSYIRTDEALSELINGLDRLYGRDQYALIVCPAPGPLPSLPEIGTRTGVLRKHETFSPDRCVALTNMYLTALYGRNSWITKIQDGILFLNRKAIETSKLSLTEVQAKTASFISEMKGVESAIPASESDRNLSPILKRRFYGRALNPSADVFFFLRSGTRLPPGQETASYSSQAAVVSAPVFFFLPQQKPRVIGRPVNALSIAPTVANVLRIRPPADAFSSPIIELIKL